MGNIFIQNHASYIGILWGGGGQVIVCMMNVSSRVGSFLPNRRPTRGNNPPPPPPVVCKRGDGKEMTRSRRADYNNCSQATTIPYSVLRLYHTMTPYIYRRGGAGGPGLPLFVKNATMVPVGLENGCPTTSPRQT